MCKEWCMWVLLKLRKSARGGSKTSFWENARKVCIGKCVFMCGYTSRHDISISLEPTDTKLSRYLTNHILLIFTKGFVDISLIARSTVCSSSIVFIKRFWQSGKKMGYKQLKLCYWHFTVTFLKENMFRKKKYNLSQIGPAYHQCSSDTNVYCQRGAQPVTEHHAGLRPDKDCLCLWPRPGLAYFTPSAHCWQ